MKGGKSAEAAATARYEVVLLCAGARTNGRDAGAGKRDAGKSEAAGRGGLEVATLSEVELPTAAQLEGAIGHTRDWPQAAREAARARQAVALVDELPSPERLGAFVARVAAEAKARGAVAIWWKVAERLVSPAALAEAARAADPLRVALNLRLFHVETGAADERVLDCIGLAALGLPDVQCHFAGLDPAQAAAVVEGTARYLFDEGDVIEDGDTVPGADGGQWRCLREEALVDPPRDVIDVTPPGPYARR